MMVKCVLFYGVMLMLDDVMLMSGGVDVVNFVLCVVVWFGDMIVIELLVFFGLI